MALVTILVTGDHGVDCDIYLHSDDDVPPVGTPPAIVRASVGGAGIIYRILRTAQEGTDGGWLQARFLAAEGLGASPTAAIWAACDLGGLGAGPADQKAKVWRARRSISLGRVDEASLLPAPVAPLSDDEGAPTKADVLVVTDNNGALRGAVPAALAALLEAPPAELPRHVILKTGAPVGHGTLWWMLVGRQELADRLVVVVPIGDLRRADVRVSQGISWERTAEDLTRELMTSTALASLRQARHLVVTFQDEGALWMARPDDPGAVPRVRLIFDPACMEGEWPRRIGISGSAYGYLSVFTTALALQAAADLRADVDLKLEQGIERGLLGMRALRVVGHGPVGQGSPGLPAAGLAGLLTLPRVGGAVQVAGAQLSGGRLGGFGRTDVPAEEGDGAAWRMLEATDRELAGHALFGKAQRIALLGTAALGNVPYARFGKLFTADRDEIEALRNLKRLMDEYSASRSETKPLSLAVFGPPGAGKSFGIKQIAETVIEDRRRAFLEFNLSQFDEPGDLIGAFHQVRDKVLEGKLPVVFWDEFDSQDYRWLQYLLAPMQDGKFQEGQITHPIGPCIFVFAGATSYTCENFGPGEQPASEDDAGRERHRAALASFRLKKGPDFKSRLHGFLNVFGPNPRQRFTGTAWADDPSDVCYPVRRAILLRSLLGLMDEKNGAKRLPIDQGLLGALLEIGYRHGSRSFEKVVSTLRPRDGAGIRRSALPSDEVLAMNLSDLGTFKRLLDRRGVLQAHVHVLAAATHARWIESAHPGNIFRKAFEELPAELRGDNVAAALRIGDVLALAGLELVPADDPRPPVAGVDRVLANHLETLAEEEHRGWMDVRLKNGWRPCPHTDDEKLRRQQREARLSDCLVPYADLPDVERQKDRDTIHWYPEAARLAGLKIVARAGAGRAPA